MYITWNSLFFLWWHGMQKLLNECKTYASKYGMKFNENKSVVLNFKGQRFKANPSAKLYLNGSLMKTAVSYTYLGHIINNNLNYNKDIERQLRNFYGKSNILLRTFGSCSYAVKLQLWCKKKQCYEIRVHPIYHKSIQLMVIKCCSKRVRKDTNFKVYIGGV